MTTPSIPSPRRALAALALLVLCAAPASATRLIPFQGRVTDGSGQPLQGVYRVTFSIYDEGTGGTALYTESHADVSVIGGQINVLLGSLVSLDDPNGDQNPVDAVQFDGALRPRYLGIKVGLDTNQEMVPRHQLVPSFHARIADTTVVGGVDTEQLADGAVTIAKVDPRVLVPAGAIMPYAGSTAPTGWVLCDGTEYDGTLPEFSALYDAIGTSFGEGSGANLFKVPDLRGQFLRGLDKSGTVDPNGANRELGSTQGSATIGLTTTPSQTSTSESAHTHHLRFVRGSQPDSVNDTTIETQGVPAVVANGPGFRGTYAPRVQAPGEANNAFSVSNELPASAHSHSVSIPSLNALPPPASTSTEVRPKNVAVNYICKL